MARDKMTSIGDATEQSVWSAVRPLGDGAPIDRAHVARIREAIAGGDYRLDPRATAAAMVEQDLPPAAA